MFSTEVEARGGYQARGQAGVQLEGLALSKCTVVWVSRKGQDWCLSLVQLQSSWTLEDAGSRRKEWGGARLRQGAPGSAKSHGAKSVYPAGDLWQLCWPSVFFQWQKLLGLSTKQVTGSHNCSHCDYDR